MATKRRLYHPAPKTILAGDKKTRKPLVQGRLVTDSPFDSREAFLADGRSQVREEGLDDPTIQPARSLPVLTEKACSHPEPLHCLDLSDTDLDVPHAGRPQSVMVFDASAMGDSSDDAEVDVVVAYEQSPARVICHTPGKLQQSLRCVSGLSCGDGPGISVRVDRVHNFGDSALNGDKRSQKLLSDQENLQMNEAKSKSQDVSESSDFLQNRGIIEEILRQELGSSNIEGISLHSEHSLLQSQTDGVLSSKSQSQTGNIEEFSFLSTNNSQKEVPTVSKSSQTKQKKQEKNVKNKTLHFPQPKFDDSDTSVDQVPVKDNIQNQQAKLHGDYSGSETCSLYEYVTSNQSQSKQVAFNNKLDSPVKPLQANQQINAPVSVKKRKLRKVPSRYLQSSLNRTTNQTSSASKNSIVEASVLKSNCKSQASASGSSRHTREKHLAEARTDRHSKKPVSGKSNRTNSNMPTKTTNTQTQQAVVVPVMQGFSGSESPQDAMRSSHEFANKQQKTSTPTHDQTCYLSQDIDASAIHSMSTVSINTSTPAVYHSAVPNSTNVPAVQPSAKPDSTNKDSVVKNGVTQKTFCKRNTSRPNTDNIVSSSSDISQLQLDLEYTRYLQWAFLNSRVSKMLQEQEKDAAAHIHTLWKMVESSRGENSQLKMDVDRLKRINLLDSVLDKTEPELDAVIAMLPQLEEDCSRLSTALDTTRHQLPTRGIYIPQGGSTEQDEHEERLETALTESEQLMMELFEVTSDKMLPLSQYLDSIEAIEKNVSASFSELQESQNEVAALKALSTRFTSLSVQDMQMS